MRLLLALLLALPLVAGCVGDDAPTVALLVADGSRAGAPFDVEAFTARVEATCADCEVEVHDAAGDATEQADQVRRAVEAEADVVAVWPVEPEEVEGVVTGDVPLVSLVTLVPGSDRFVGMAAGEPELDDQGSDLEAARDLVLGERRTVTYVPVQPLSEQAADVVVGQLAGTPIADGEEHEGVMSWLFEATQVTLDDLTTVLVGEGVITLDDLCEGSTAKRCERYGLR